MDLIIVIDDADVDRMCVAIASKLGQDSATPDDVASFLTGYLQRTIEIQETNAAYKAAVSTASSEVKTTLMATAVKQGL
jgi:uncharacterized protein YcbX